MKHRTINWIGLLLTLPVLLSILFSPALTATAQETPPETCPDKYPEKPYIPEHSRHDEDGYIFQTEDGKWHKRETSVGGRDQRVVRDTGGPDDFGYTWERLETGNYEWVDVSSGINTDLDGNIEFTEKIDLGFDFDYYENTYDGVYISKYGFVSFDNQALWRTQSPILDPDLPNNVIAPNWMPAHDINYVKYNYGGTAPDRWFVVEWNQLINYENTFTFELILYESGAIQFQYGNMIIDWRYSCMSSGIEDSTGAIGLEITPLCEVPDSNHAIRITRPEPGYRASLSPRFQGSFVSADAPETFEIMVRNSGDLGADRYDLTANSNAGWDVLFFDAGMTPISSTEELAEDESQTVLVQVTAPPGASMGDEDRIEITASSVNDPTKTRTGLIDAAIPAPFAQTYRNEDEYSVQTQLIWPVGQLDVPVSHWEYPFEPAIVETPQGNFVHVWRGYEKLNEERDGYVLKYVVVDQFGEVVTPVTQLSTHYTGDTGDHYTHDYKHALAVTPDGNVGVIWTRWIRRYSDWTENYNVWFAVISPTGKLVHSPERITHNDAFGNWENGYYHFDNTKIAASQDNRFMLAWARFYMKDRPPTWQGSVMMTIRRSGGAAVTGNQNITGVVNNTDIDALSLTPLTDNRFFLTYVRYDLEYDPAYGHWWVMGRYPKCRVYNSAGAPIVAEQRYSYNADIIDSIQTTSGRVFMATYDWNPDINKDSVSFTILDGDDCSFIYQPPLGLFSHPSGVEYDSRSLSVTQDQDGNAIMTWMDKDGKLLFYALIDPDGNLLSGPSIFETGSFLPGQTGCASTTNSSKPYSGVDLMTEFSSAAFRAKPGETGEVKFRFANLGISQATDVNITLTLEDGLSYIDYGDSPYIGGWTYDLINNIVTFYLSDLNFGDNDEITVFVGLPSDSEPDDIFTLELAIHSNEDEADLDNNVDQSLVIASGLNQNYLPFIVR